jgi:hypothetical protein
MSITFFSGWDAPTIGVKPLLSFVVHSGVSFARLRSIGDLDLSHLASAWKSLLPTNTERAALDSVRREAGEGYNSHSSFVGEGHVRVLTIFPKTVFSLKSDSVWNAWISGPRFSHTGVVCQDQSGFPSAVKWTDDVTVGIPDVRPSFDDAWFSFLLPRWSLFSIFSPFTWTF